MADDRWLEWIACGMVGGRWWIVGGLLNVIAKGDMLERDLARQASDRALCRLNHARIGIDQRKHPLARRQPLLKLAPEGRDTCDRVEENREALDEQIPIADRDGFVDYQAPTGIHHHRDRNTLQGVHQRIDTGE